MSPVYRHRYYRLMQEPARASLLNDSADVADLLVRLGRLAYAEPGDPSLTPTQWMVLRYFARANRFSRTVSAFAAYHASTRGTASQSIKTLVESGYLSRTRSDADGRSARLDLTEKGCAALEADPCRRLDATLSALQPSQLTDLRRYLWQSTESMVRTGQCREFGTCRRCDHLRGEQGRSQTGALSACKLLEAALGPDDLDQLCANFKPTSAGEQSASGA